MQYKNGYTQGFQAGILEISQKCLMDKDYVCYPLNVTKVVNKTIIKTQTVVVNNTITVEKNCTVQAVEKCPTCEVCKLGVLSVQQNDWLLNKCQIRDGAACYQAGSADTCDKVRDYLEVPNRPKFKTRPSTGMYPLVNPVEDQLYCFKNLGGYFVLNRTEYIFNNSMNQNITRYQWSWNDSQCLRSWMEVKHL